MTTTFRLGPWVVLSCAFAAALAGCPEEGKRPIGSSCNTGAECDSGFCAGEVCLDPNADSDGDSLINSLEAQIGSDWTDPDSDGDGLRDDAELEGVSLVDTDGDGIADILDSLTLDEDGDCIPNQLDADNLVPSSDLSPMRDIVCPDEGICAGQDRALFGVLCPEPARVAVCDFSRVVGHEAEEASCDGLDNDCDGDADEGFPDQDADGRADCVDDDFDNDGVADASDNCPVAANADQADAQADGLGDVCAAAHALRFNLAPLLPLAAGAPFDAAVAVTDPDGATPTRFHGAVTLALRGGAPGATLTGSTTATAVDGVATFTGLAVTAAGEAFALVATSAELAEGQSEPFDVTPGALARLAPTGTPATLVAGDPAPFTLTALDAWDNVLTTYDGALTFTSTDPLATLPADVAFTTADAGELALADLVLRTAGLQTVNIVDVATEAVLASFEVLVTPAPAATFALAGLPPALTAGAPTALTVTALDPYGNTDTAFAGTARFAVDDPAATLPADLAFGPADLGVRTTAELVLRTAGPHLLTLAPVDALAPAGSAALTVVPAPAAALVLTPSADPIAAGTPFDVEVRVVDAFGNTVTDFTGPFALTSTDPLATLPATYTFTAADAGVHVFTGVTLVSAGEHGVGAAAPGTDAAGTVAVAVTSASDLVFALSGLPTPATAGQPFTVTVTVRDVFGNLVPDYAGTLALLASDPAAVLPAPRTLTAADHGVATFAGVVLKTAGAQTLTAADDGHGVYQSASVEVRAAAAAALTATGPATVTAGTPFALSVTARDAFGNLATAYASTLVFASSDPGATLPSDPAFPAGAGTHTYSGLALTTAGPQTLTLGDLVNGELTATFAVTVTPAAAASVTLSAAPSAVTAGAPFGLTATLRDAFGNVATAFTGTLALTSTDPQAALPAAHAFTAADAGAFAFTGLALKTAGAQTLTAAVAGAPTLRRDLPVTVAPAAAASLVVTPGDPAVAAGVTTTLAVRARDAFGNRATGYTGTVRFAAPGDPQVTLPPATAFSAADAGERVFSGVVFRTIGAQTVNVVDAGRASIAGSATVTVQQGSQFTYELSGLPASTSAGTPFSLTLAVRDLFGNPITTYTGTVAFTVTDAATGQPVSGATLPASYTFKTTDLGTHTFTGLTLTSARATTLRVAEVGTPALAASAVVTVTPGPMARLALTNTPTAATAGTPFSARVTAYDAYDNVATAFTGPVAFASSRPGATLPSDGTLSAGARTFTGLALTQAGATTLTVSSGTASDEALIPVAHAAPAALELSALPATVGAGVAQSLTATLKDAYGNVATTFTGTAALSTTDPAVTGSTLDFQASHQGQRAFSVTFRTAGARQLTLDAGGALSASRATTVVAAAAASLAVTGPSSATAGTPFALTVTARDAFGNLATGYAATLTFASNDPAATLPASGAFAAGTGTQAYSGLALKTAGAARTVTVTDPATPGLTATLTLAVTPAAAATVNVASPPTAATAGVPFDLAVTLRDTYGNVATTYAGPLAVTATDGAADLPAAYTFSAADAGVHTFTGVRLRTAGAQTVTVGAPGSPTLKRDLALTVAPAAAADLVVTPSSTTVPAGTALSVVVRAVDAFGNRATGYRGTVRFTAAGDPQATLPANTAFTAADNGERVFGGVTLRTVGSQVLAVADTTTAGLDGSATVTVQQGAQVVFQLSGLPTTATAGASLSATLAVKDSFGNPITNYTGTVAFTAVDATSGQPVTGATLPANYAFKLADQGSHTFTGIALTQARNTLIRVTQVDNAALTASAPVAVTPAAMSRLALSNVPAAVTAGAAFGVRVTAYDAYDNVATAYVGPVSFSASRAGATLPTDGALSAGTRDFSGLVFTLAGSTVLTVSGGAASTQATLPVSAANASTLELSALPGTVVAGTTQSLTATLKDPYGNVATSFVGSAALSSTDPQVAPSTLDFQASHLGTRTFTVVFKTAGARAITLNAGGALTATRSTTVTPAATASYQVGALSSQVTAGAKQTLAITLYDAHGNVATGGYAGAFTLATSDPAGVLSATSLTIGLADAGTKSFDVTFKTAGAQSVTVTQSTLGVTTRSTTVRAGAAAALAVADLPSSVTAGVSQSVLVRVLDAFGNLVTGHGGTVALSSTDGTATFSPASPVAFPAGQPASVTVGVTLKKAGAQSVTFTEAGLGAAGTVTKSTTVKAAAAHSVAVAPTSGAATAGTAFDLTVTLSDAYGNVATGYTGTMSFTSDDARATLPAATTFTAANAGTRTFSATLATAGARTVTATDATLPGTKSATLSRTVAHAAALARLTVVPSVTTATAGVSFSATVTPLDAYDNVMTGFTGSATMATSDPAGAVPTPVTLSGVTSVTPIVLKTAGARTVSATVGAVSASGAVTVAPAAAHHIAWTTQPAAGEAGINLPSMRVAIVDAFDNVVTTQAATTVTLSLGRNAGPARLSGTVSTSTVSGVATFSAVQLSRPGKGFDLVAAVSGFTSVRSARFDVAWRAPSLSSAPVVSGAGGCRYVDYVVKHPNGTPADVLVEYRVGAGAWQRATEAPVSAGDTDGATGVTTSATGEAHTFGWDAFADLGRVKTSSVTVRVTPRVGASVGAALSSTAATYDFGWALDTLSHPLSPGLVHGAIVTGDYDRGGLEDIVVVGRATNTFDILYQLKRNEFVLEKRIVDIGNIDVIAARPWREGGHDLGFFLLDAQDSELYVFQRTAQGPASVGWSFQGLDACPDPKNNTPVALAVGHTQGTAMDEAFVACEGTGTSAPSVSWVAYSSQSVWAVSGTATLAKKPTALEVGDLGRNGYRDLIVGDEGGLRTLISQSGDGFCQSASCAAQVIAMAPPKALATADFNADGQLDVVAVHGTPSASYVAGDLVVNTGGLPVRFLATAPTALALTVEGTSVVVGDFDRDGDPDLAVGSGTKDEVELLLNDGKGHFATAGVFSTGGPADFVSGLVATDLDADGQVDVVAARQAPTNPAVARLDGAPVPQCRPSFEAAGAARFAVNAASAEVADLDGDARPDTFWAAESGSAATGLLIGLGDGAGGYLRTPVAFPTAVSPSDLAVGDLNGDSLLDAVVVAGTTDNAFVALQSAGQPGTFTQGYLPTAFADVSAPSVNIVDMDLDGRQDLVFLGEGAVRPYYQGATGTLSAGTAVSVSGTSLRGLSTADVNKDGYQDLAFFRFVAGVGDQVCVLRSKGARTFEAASGMPCLTIDSGEGRARLVDLDGDGIEELVYVNEVDYYQPVEVHVRRQTAADTGLFGAEEAVQTCYGGNNLQVADVDGDGRLDLSVACSNLSGAAPYAVETHRQSADGSFATLGTGFGVPRGMVRSLAAVDATGDQRVDGVYGGTVTRQAASGGWLQAQPWPSSTASPSLLGVGDLNGDTLPDVVTASGNAFTVLLQVEPGKYGDPVSYTMATVSSTQRLALADADNDGRLDVVVGVTPTTGNRQLRIYRQNQKTPGVFDPTNGVQSFTAPVTGSPVALASDDISGSGAPSQLVSWASDATLTRFTVYVPTGPSTYLTISSDPYTSSTFPIQVAGAGFGWFGGTLREPVVAGKCGSTPCAVVGMLGTCDVPGSLCFRSKVQVNLGAGAAAPLYTSIGGLAVADLDRDGYDDLVASLGGANDNHVYAIVRHDPDKPGSFVTMKTFTGAQAPAGRVHLADVNHDGLLDLVGQFDGGLALGYEVLLGEGDGTSFGRAFAVATGLSDAAASYGGGDFDRDGWLDLFTNGASASGSGVVQVAPQR